MKGRQQLLLLLLAAAVNPQWAFADEPLPYACSLVLRGTVTQETTLRELFSRRSDISGAYVCRDNHTGRLAWYNEAFGPYKSDEVEYFRLSEASTIVMIDVYPAVNPLELGLLACFDVVRRCSSSDDYATVMLGIPETDVSRFRSLWDEFRRRHSSGELLLHGIGRDASLMLLAIFANKGDSSVSFVVEDRLGNQVIVDLRNDTPGFEVIGSH